MTAGRDAAASAVEETTDPGHPVEADVTAVGPASAHASAVSAAHASERIEACLDRAEETDDAEEATHLLLEVARLYESALGNPEKAFRVLRVAFQETPGHPMLWRWLCRLAGQLNRWDGLLQTAQTALSQAQSAADRLALTKLLASLYADLGRLDYAEPYDQAVLAQEPENLDSLRRLVLSLRMSGRFEALHDALRALSERATATSERAHAYVEMGELSEVKLARPTAAARLFKLALELEPRHPRALAGLERCFAREARTPELIELLEHRRQLCGPEEALDLSERVFELRRGEPLHDEARIDCYLSVLDEEPDNNVAYRRLEALLEGREDWGRLVEVLADHADVAETAREERRVLLKLAAILETKLGRLDEAAGTYERVVEKDPRSLPALEALSRLYEALHMPDSIADALEWRAAATSDRKARISTLKRLAAVCVEPLRDYARATEAYERVLALAPNDARARVALSDLFALQGRAADALEALALALPQAPDEGLAVEVGVRKASILLRALGRSAEAETVLKDVLTRAPQHAEALSLLAEAREARGDWGGLVGTLESALECAATPEQKAPLWLRLGRLYRDHFQDPAASARCFEAALEVDASSFFAIVAVFSATYDAQEWERAWPYAQQVFERLTELDETERVDFASRYAKLASELGHTKEAVRALVWLNKCERSLDFTWELAEAYFHDRNWEMAWRQYRLVLVRYERELERAKLAQIRYRLGSIRHHEGDVDAARECYHRALVHNPAHRPSLQALAELHLAEGRLDEAEELYAKLIELIEDGEERCDQLLSLADVLSKMGGPGAALRPLAQALALSPDDVALAHRLLAVCKEAGDWPLAVQTIDRIASAEPEPRRAARYVYTAGVILRDELHDSRGALARFEHALSLHSEDLKPFEAVDKLLTSTKDWVELDAAYRRMLARIEPGSRPEVERSLWHCLGLLLRDRLARIEDAAVAFSRASELDPDDAGERVIIAELGNLRESLRPAAVAEHRWLIEHDPYRLDSYHELFRLHRAMGALDPAFVVANALVLLGRAEPAEQAFFEEWSQQPQALPSTAIDDGLWLTKLAHPDDDHQLGSMLAALAGTMTRTAARPDRDLHLFPRHAVNLKDPNDRVGSYFAHLCQVLGTHPGLRLFVRADAVGGFGFVPGSLPAAVVTGGSIRDRSPRELVFLMARHLAYYRPEHFGLTLCPSLGDVERAVGAARLLAGQRHSRPGVSGLSHRLSPHLTAAEFEVLKRRSRKSAERGPPDVQTWLRAVERTACRAGLLVVGDLEVAARMIGKIELPFELGLSPQDLLRDLVAFALSEAYAELRRTLGIAIRPA